MIKEKFCNRCKTSKPLTEFYVSQTTGKTRPGCKDCQRADSRKRDPRWYKKNRAAGKAKVIRWQKRNPERVRSYARDSMRRLRRKRRESGTGELPLL